MRTSDSRPADWPDGLEWDEELFQERAAIREFDGRFSRPSAEKRAREDVLDYCKKSLAVY